MERFEEWRRRYKDMTYQEQLAFYDWVGRAYPHQVHYDLPGFVGAFEHFDSVLDGYGVLEVGGWRGELAAALLSNGHKIRKWVNYEIARPVLEMMACQDERYSALVAEDFVWNVELFQGEVFVASDMIEHVSGEHLEALFANLPPSVQHIALKSPLGHWTQADGWRGYCGSHILELDWQGVAALLSDYGFEQAQQYGGVRTWERR